MERSNQITVAGKAFRQQIIIMGFLFDNLHFSQTRPALRTQSILITRTEHAVDFCFYEEAHAPNFKYKDKRFRSVEEAIKTLSPLMTKGDVIEIADCNPQSRGIYSKVKGVDF